MKKYNENSIDTLIFSIAHHYLLADEEDAILKYCYVAGKMAKDNFSNNDALNYLEAVVRILEKGSDSLLLPSEICPV